MSHTYIVVVSLDINILLNMQQNKNEKKLHKTGIHQLHVNWNNDLRCSVKVIRSRNTKFVCRNKIGP